MKKFILIGLFIVCSQMLMGQSIDEERMNRDLEVAKNVLSTLYGQGSGMVIWAGNRIDASYLPGYGVIINVPEDVMYITGIPRPPRPGRRGAVIIGSTGKEKDKELITAYSEENDENIEDIEAIEDIEKVEGPDTEEIIRTFFADYADLIGQLKPEDKIMVKQKSGHEDFSINWSGDAWGDHESGMYFHKPVGLTAEITKKDISAYKQGRISRSELNDRIIITESKQKEKVADLEMFANMIRSYYSPEISKTFFTEGRPGYEVLDGFGAIYHMKTYSSYQDGDIYVLPMLEKKEVDESERKEIIEEMYPKFEKELKEFIVDYGRTIRSLDDDEVLMLKVKLTRCKGCSIPSNIDVSLKAGVLKDYDQQKINRDKALGSIEIKKYEQ